MTRPALKLMVIRCRGAALGGTWVERGFLVGHVAKWSRYSKTWLKMTCANYLWTWYLKTIFEYDSIFKCQNFLNSIHTSLDISFLLFSTFQTTRPTPHPTKISTLVSQAAEAGAQCPSHDGKIKTVPGHKDKVQSSRKSPDDDGSPAKPEKAKLRKVGLVIVMKMPLVVFLNAFFFDELFLVKKQ